MSFHRFKLASVLLFGAATLAGCGDQNGADQQAKRDPAGSQSTAANQEHSGEQDCEHVEKGPHGGQVFELGGAYHAELVHDDKSGLISVYLLDEQVRDAVAIEDAQIVVNAMVQGKPATFELAAAPLPSDAEGRSSRFQSKDDALLHSLEDHDSKSRLRANIEGKQYVTDVTACEEHDHEGHDHTK